MFKHQPITTVPAEISQSVSQFHSQIFIDLQVLLEAYTTTDVTTTQSVKVVLKYERPCSDHSVC